ncbi:MAG: 3-dehydroquinate synthase [Dehalococcoidia bacterium]
MSDALDQDLATVVHTSQGNYRVLVGRGVIDRIGPEMSAAGLGGRAFIIADRVLFPDGVRRVQEALESGGFPAHVLAIQSGETAKDLDTARQMYGWLAEQRAERSDTIVALGGGVIGDLAGFVAATWLRGVPFVQVPTSMAAMVDASIGGKVAVNLPQGKNLVGAFHQPKLVIAEIAHLATLPPRELASGWAEAIKHGFILDARLLDTLDRHAGEMLALSGDVAVEAIRRSVAIKADVVSADEFERGDERVLLNYGHTVGHALEAITEYGTFLHGEAVSVGIMAAAGIALRLGMIDPELLDRQRGILEKYGLPVRAQGVSVDAVLNATRSDKKSRGGSIRWVLLTGPGEATTRRDVPEQVVRDAIFDVVDEP